MTDPEPLRRVARMVADGTPVDWAVLAETHPELRSRLEILRGLAALAQHNLSNSAAGARSRANSTMAVIQPEPPFRWGTLEVRERIGAGSFGIVYRAFDPALDREVALKLRAIGTQETDLAALLDEARLLARVRHPNVLAIHGVEVCDGSVGLWTDLLTGVTLEERLLQEGPLPAEDVARAGIFLARALAAVHDSGLIHGDIKTSNAIVEGDGRTVLMDFGASTRSHTPSATAGGTPLFMAPELLRGEAPSVATDLYSLGVVLYRLLTGKYPIEAANWDELLARHSSGGRISLDEIRPGLSTPLVRGIERALSPEAVDRPVTASELEIYLRASFDPHTEPWSEDPTMSQVPGLPGFSTRFIGRRAELLAVRRLLAEPGLVTLIGAGGAGKTRLAHRAAQDLSGGMPGGVTWVDLSGTASADRVTLLVARALGIQETSGTTLLDAVGEYLAAKAALLVLDNCEHLVGAVADLARSLHSRASRLRLLATSRVPLRVEGERVYRVPSLAVPPPGETSLKILDAEAVRLFVNRAGRGRADFLLTPSQAPAVARIVRRVDGIPLAIELAAARVATLGIATVADRLDAGFRLLDGRGPDTFTRHATIRASIAWSYDILRPAEARLLDRLAVMAGSFRLEAAEAVCGDEGSEAATIAGEEVLELLASLVDVSLVQFEPEPRPRYRLLEMVRVFVESRLDDVSEVERLRRRHLSWCLTFAMPLNRSLYGPEQQTALAALDDERDNFRAALIWGAQDPAASEHDKEVSLNLCTELRRYWLKRGYLREGVELTTAAADQVSTESVALGFAALAISSLLSELGDASNAERWVERAIAILRGHDRPALLAGALVMQSQIANLGGDYDRSREVLLDACEIHRVSGNKVALAYCVGNLGVTEGRAGNAEASEARYREALGLFRELGDETSSASILGNLGYLSYQRGDLEAARAHFRESLAAQRRSTDLSMLGFGLAHSALVEVAAGARTEARALLLEACSAVRRNEQAQQMIALLEASARLLATVERPDGAARLIAAATALREASRSPRYDSDRTSHEVFVQSLREAVGETRFALASAEGRTTPSKELLDLTEETLTAITLLE